MTKSFFIVSLDELSTRLNLPSDVAGATLMAIGSSAPELAIAIIALVNRGGAHSDIGIGAIVGSALFNMLVITGAAAIIRPLKVTFPIITRDTIVYTLSLGLLLWVFWDGTITIGEAALFLILYAGYIGILYLWSLWSLSTPEVDPATTTVQVLEDEQHPPSTRPGRLSRQIDSILHVLMGNPRHNHLRTFLISIALIVILSWVLVESGISFATAVGINPLIVALTIIAGGTSVPDMLSSIIVARQGRGNMAVSNAIGSNIFDILIGLGLPWLLIIIAGRGSVSVGTEGLLPSILLLVASVIVLYFFALTKLAITRREGVVLVLFWLSYVAWIYSTAA